MSLLIENLIQFNRKERFHLLAGALGWQRTENKLDPQFSKKICEITGLELPPKVFLAIDYHLDWLHAALVIAGEGKSSSDVKWNPAKPAHFVFPRGPEGERQISRTQRDIDLLVAYDDPKAKVAQLLLIEAKFDTSWGNPQFKPGASFLPCVVQ